MCQPNGESTAFLCPNGTMFNQQYFVCDWWYNLGMDDTCRTYSSKVDMDDTFYYLIKQYRSGRAVLSRI